VQPETASKFWMFPVLLTKLLVAVNVAGDWEVIRICAVKVLALSSMAVPLTVLNVVPIRLPVGKV
jgi:hypothetical protein